MKLARVLLGTANLCYTDDRRKLKTKVFRRSGIGHQECAKESLRVRI